MTKALVPPPRKNPQARSVAPTRPPEARSRAALGLTAAAAEGRFALQCCADCGQVCYPPRDACPSCLSPDLAWQDVSPMGTLLAETTIRASPQLYFRERVPWRMGSVKLDAGPVILAHLHGEVPKRARVAVKNKLDRAGQAVLIATPEQPGPDAADDPELRAMSSDPKHRRVLVTDGRHPAALALTQALFAAGAAAVYVGEAEAWRGMPARAALEAAGAEILPLDVTDTASVRRMASEYGGKTDIVINTAHLVRPGGALARGDATVARDEIEVHYLGLLRLSQAFGPALCARTADGTNSAVAWVNLFFVHALAPAPDFGCYAASQAAAHALSQSLRGEFRASGLRVMNVFSGPLEDEWFQTVPPPKVMPGALARSVVDGLRDGLEDVWCGDVARDIRARRDRDPKVLEREMTPGGDG
jgi:NAD(P)-dependent dehydrogenase (short-subunit alcohol dehydrogenase family)/uncharacterized OB-fold protein